jgi:hypothetical protein
MNDSRLDPIERVVAPQRSQGDPRLIRAMSAHVEKYIGRIGWVLHDLTSDVVHVDLLWVAPGPRRDFHTFVTCGMSERAMHAPSDRGDCRHAELLLRLPSTWTLGVRELGDERNNWPLQELDHLARMPHVYATWLWDGHTVANGNPPEPLTASTDFSGTILAPATWVPRGFRTLRVDPDRTVRFFSVIPVYAEELLLARDAGCERLLDEIERAGITDLLDVRRPSVVVRATGTDVTAGG